MEDKSSFATIAEGFSGADLRRLKKIWEFSKAHLSTIQRRSGEDYSTHGLEVALALLEGNKDASLIAIALLHDVLVHPNGKHLLNKSPLSAKEQSAVKTMNQLRRLHIDANTKDLNKFTETILQSGHLIPVRIAHRVNDVRHLERFMPQLQKKIAHESLHMYSSIAGRLGMHKWRYEMEDICFKKLHKRPATNLQKKFQAYQKLDHICLTQTSNFLQKKLQEAKIPVRVEIRLKTLYSTYRKLMLKKRQFEELTDRLAVRFITKNLEDCYRCLGIIHSHMNPIAGKLKDYIGAPKENGYQSIHTVVYPLPGVTEQPIEIQIRTEEMHKTCEYGTAAHGDYKNFNYSLKSGLARVDLIKNFQILRLKGRSPAQFEEALRTYFDENQMAIFDDKNNLYHIKRPASVLDFLCTVYPKKIPNIHEVRLNGRVTSIDTELHDGDVVETKFRRHRAITPQWTQACKQRENARQVKEIVNYLS